MSQEDKNKQVIREFARESSRTNTTWMASATSSTRILFNTSGRRCQMALRG